MAVIDVKGLAFAHADGTELFREVDFRVANGKHVALVGANGVGKSTLLLVVDGELKATAGAVHTDGAVVRMPQAIGSETGLDTVRQLLITFSSPHLRDSGERLHRAEQAFADDPTEEAGAALADAVAEWAERGGYEHEAGWDAATQAVLRQSFAVAADRPVDQLSGGERKRLVLEALFASDIPILLLDEPDNFLDLDGKVWLARQIRLSAKTILFVSHDRELLARAADSIVTLEGLGCWVHAGSFATYDDARRARHDDLARSLKRWEDEERRLFRHFKLLKQRAAQNDGNAGRANAAETRWKHFVAVGPPPPPPPEKGTRMRLTGSRSGKRVIECRHLELSGLTEAFDFEAHLGDRVAVLGPNGSGKSHFLRLLGGDRSVAFEGDWTIGASVQVGLFHQTSDLRGLHGRTPLEAVSGLGLTDQPARSALARYGLAPAAERDVTTLSGGQRARLQILLLELEGANCLLLDEPTDNLDLLSAEALEGALEGFTGTVLAVTHDRWFMRTFDRFLLFDYDCTVHEELDLDAALAALGAVEPA